MHNTYLQIKQLNKRYGAKNVVSDVNLTMEEGEILSLLGPSGCGKTTMLRMIAGLIAPDSGWIGVGGQVFYDGKRALEVEERQIGMVFQDYALWPHMTVAKNIAFGMRLRRKPGSEIRKKVEQLLELVNLPGVGQRYPYELSGGQQQRVAVARALATEPRLVLMDEPLSSLDAGLRENMRTELVQLFRHLKITVINVTHDRDEAMSMSDRIMVLRDGKVQQCGTPTDLYLYPHNPFVASFMGYANMLSGEVVESTDTDMVLLRLTENTQGQLIVQGKAQTAGNTSIAGKTYLLFRPENIRVSQEMRQLDHTNHCEGKVVHTSFVGGQWRTLIALDGVTSTPILTFPPFRPQIAQRLWLEFPPEYCQVIVG
ncbi:ABC transporter ATP-binding protein [Tengunoibacter tsumagoiensis]|uniref:ABC-type quaternary amine transporter n=1 Tax=Tengunoibacter tsumagoiensis TaxID=2014871 RepID=A0A402A7T3_9CHLR|nr:ABC transporter ATP-binding protein [Tengunoibacter tsumagoiensis]GCE15227.1 ABC transporter ATP-binding protein [Tengunoibacter tsumagoiensis]